MKKFDNYILTNIRSIARLGLCCYLLVCLFSFGQTYILTNLGVLMVILAIDLIVFFVEKLIRFSHRTLFKNL